MFSGATSVCTAECCTNLDAAHQPTAQCILAKTKVKVGRQCRTFQSTWYKSYPWITLCETSGRVFCHVCRHSCITMSKQSEPAFTASGFFNWRRAIERFKIHEQKPQRQKTSINGHENFVLGTRKGQDNSIQISVFLICAYALPSM